jgi:hypothetical protein
MMNAIARAGERHVALLNNPNADEVATNFQNSGLSWSRNIQVSFFVFYLKYCLIFFGKILFQLIK